MKKKLLWVMIVLMVVAVGGGWFYLRSSHRATKKSQPALPVNVQKVIVKNIPIELNAVGTLIASELVNISAEVDGYVSQVDFNSGEFAKKGTVLLKLDDVKAKAELLSAESELRLTKLKYERAHKLLRTGVVAQQDVDSLYADYQKAKSGVSEAKDTFDKKTIRAPFSGYLGEKIVNSGDYITSGQKIVECVNRNKLKVNYSVPEQYLMQLQLGQSVQVIASSFPKKTFLGTVQFISPSVDASTHTVLLQAVIPNTDNQLAPGLFVQVRQILGQDKKMVLVPEQSIVKSLDKTLIYKVENGKAVSVEVETGDIKDGNVEILKGLTVDDQVIIAGQQKLKDGDAVQVVQ